jgi:predicted DNA-binding protein with PD1-like motif
MQSTEITLGRSFQLVFDHGDSFLLELKNFCRNKSIRAALIPMFIAGFAEVDLVGTCDTDAPRAAPVWDTLRLHDVEAVGAGTIVYDGEGKSLQEHIHVAVGRKFMAAQGYTSHLKRARVSFTCELTLTEVHTPMYRERDPDLFDVPLLRV